MLRLKGTSLKPILVFCIIGTVFFVILSMSVYSSLFKYSKYDEVYAIVVELDHKNKDAYVRYPSNNNVLTKKNDTYSDKWVIGKSLIAYVNPHNGEDMKVLIDLFILPTIMLMFVIFAGLVIVVLIIIRNSIIKQKTKTKNFNYGFIAHVIDVYNPYKRKSNNFMQMKVVYEDKEYKSDILVGDLVALQQKLLTNDLIVKIYFNPKNIRDYFIDYKNIVIN